MTVLTAAGPTFPLTLEVIPTDDKTEVNIRAFDVPVGLSLSSDSVSLKDNYAATSSESIRKALNISEPGPPITRIQLAPGEAERISQVQELLLAPYQSIFKRLRASSLFTLLTVVGLVAFFYLGICCMKADANLDNTALNYAAMQHQADLMRLGCFIAALAMLGVISIHIPSLPSDETNLPLLAIAVVYLSVLLLVIKSLYLIAHLWGKLILTWLDQPVAGFPLWLVLVMVATALALVRAVYLDFVLPAKQKRLLEQTLGKQE